MSSDTFYQVDIANLTPGDDWRIPIPMADAVWEPGDTARMQVRVTPASPTFIVELTRAGRGIELNAGELVLVVGSAATALIAPGAYVYDLEVTRAGAVDTIMGGTLTVRRDITR